MLAALFCVLAAGPARAANVVKTVDFETGPPAEDANGAGGTPVTDDYKSTAFVYWQQGDGFRPYRRMVAHGAHSGTYVADIGAQECQKEYPTSGGCEFPPSGTRAHLTRTASAVTVWAGLFAQPSSEVDAQLTAYDADNTQVGQSTVYIAANEFDTPVTVTSSSPNIASFTLDSANSGSDTSEMGFDDLTLTFPSTEIPDISPNSSTNVNAVLDGQTTDIPITITRLNGSSGPVQLSASNLPAGVTAQFSPNPVTGTDDTATLELTASVSAPSTNFQADNVTITADPGSDADVAPAARTATVPVRVATPYTLSATGLPSAVLPACAPVDFSVLVARDITFNGTVTLSLGNLPQGVSAQILPSATIAPGGNVNVPRTIEFTRSATAALPASVTLTASSPSTPSQTVTIPLSAAAGNAGLASTLGDTPRQLTPGTQIRVTGNGFCPGTQLFVGNADAPAAATIVDPHTVTFNVPRLATSGPVTIVPPAGAPYTTTGTPLTINSLRNVNGFQFANYPYGSLSISELTEAFGSDDLFIQVNPCWPWGDCTVNTGFLDPIAALDWGILDVVLHESGGHCFGISRAAWQFLTGKEPYADFASVSSTYALPSAGGPGSALNSYLDAEHALQGSAEFLSAYLGRDKTLSAQLATLHDELAAGRDPIVTINDQGEGHALLAYDEQATSTGEDVYVYDSNRPFKANENTSADAHQSAVDESVIHVDPTHGTWSFDIDNKTGWSGNGDSLFVMPQSTIPDNPSLPGIETLAQAAADEILSFGSTDGSVTTGDASGGVQYLPVLDSHAPPNGAGWWMRKGGGKPFAVTFTGRKRGDYVGSFSTAGFTGALTGVATKPGVHDRLVGTGGGLSFASGMARALRFSLAHRLSGAHASAVGDAKARTWSAVLDTHASAKGGDDAGLTPGGTLSYTHDGAPTSISFTLSTVSPEGAPSTFNSGPITVANGDHVSAQPIGASLSEVKLTTRGAHGHARTTVLRNHAHSIARLTVTALRVTSAHKVLSASVRTLVSKLHGHGLLGVTLRLFSGRRAVAHHTLTLKNSGNGKHKFTWRLPKERKGRYRLLVDVRLIALPAKAGAATGSVAATRAGAVRIP